MMIRCLRNFALGLVVAISFARPGTASFNDVASWTTYDPGGAGVGAAAQGFRGGVSDGRYLYFVPALSGQPEILRYDSTAAFADPMSWNAFDPGVGAGLGYAHGCFDGRYVYFAPGEGSGGPHGNALRYDTTANFDAAASYEVIDLATIWPDATGYWGADCNADGFVYFSPEGTGRVVRYDRSLPFTMGTSWQDFEPRSNGLGVDPSGYHGLVSVGQYLYFAPFFNTASHGEMLRYDTSADFSLPSSWLVYDPGQQGGVGNIAEGYGGAVSDGRYVYYIPRYRGFGENGFHGEVMRYDTMGAFDAAGSWEAYDPGASGVGFDPDGYSDAYFDGRFIYFAPNHHGTPDGPHGEVLRYDTAAPFDQPSSWSTFDAGTSGVGVDPDGYSGVVTDGTALYFVPDTNEVGVLHGEFLRFELPAPEMVSFTAVHDAKVASTRLTSNFGDTTDLRVRASATGANWFSYLSFDLSGAPPTFQQATLRIHVTDGSPSGGTLHLLPTTFDESTITFGNAPPCSASPVAMLGAVTAGVTAEVDLSSVVTGPGVYDFCLASSSSNSAFFSSSEGEGN